jgi:hypothetical protein
MLGSIRPWKSWLCVVVIALCCAQSYGAVSVSLSDTSAPSGGIAVVTLNLNETTDLPTALVIDLAFDIVLATICKVAPGSAAGDATVDYNATDGGMTLILFGPSAPLANGVLATLYVEIADSTPPDTTISIADNASSAANMNAQGLDLTLSATSIAVLPLTQAHDADTDGNGRMGLSEVLRAVQLYSVGVYYCDEESEDGYSITSGAQDCSTHDLDFNAPDWNLDLSELLRCIQFFNAFKGSYHLDVAGEDGFAPGLE